MEFKQDDSCSVQKSSCFLEIPFFKLSLTKGTLYYLQVFNISIIDKDKGIVKIEHTQEIPEYKKTSIIKSKEVRNNLKVFVILEAEYATMLLASEY